MHYVFAIIRKKIYNIFSNLPKSAQHAISATYFLNVMVSFDSTLLFFTQLWWKVPDILDTGETG